MSISCPPPRSPRALALLPGVLSFVAGLAAASGVGACGIEVTTALSNPVLPAGKKTTTYLRVALGGGGAIAGHRAPVNVALVIDRSGSMTGTKIERAKEAAVAAVEMLGSDDIVSLVAYDSTVEVVVPATKLADREAVIQRIRALGARGSTALFAGVSKGAAEVRKFRAADRVNRVVLLSDGLANVGPSSPGELQELGVSLRKEGISVTTLGLGLDYNEDLMAALARSSDGNHNFVEDATHLASYFRSEFGAIFSVVAQDVDVRIDCAAGVRPIRLLGREGDIRGQTVEVGFNQLYTEQTKYALLEVEVPAAAAGKTLELARVRVSYSSIGAPAREVVDRAVSGRTSASEAEVAKAVDAEVAASAVLQIANRNSETAMALRDAGKLDEARRTLLDNAAYLGENFVLYRDPELKRFCSVNQEDATKLAGTDWIRTRKDLKAEQHRNITQQGTTGQE